MSIQDFKKKHNLSNQQMEEIRKALDIAYKSIAINSSGVQSRYEKRIVEIMGGPEDWGIAEDVAQAFFEEGQWPEVFETFYSSDLKFKDFYDDWKRKRGLL